MRGRRVHRNRHDPEQDAARGGRRPTRHRRQGRSPALGPARRRAPPAPQLLRRRRRGHRPRGRGHRGPAPPERRDAHARARRRSSIRTRSEIQTETAAGGGSPPSTIVIAVGTDPAPPAGHRRRRRGHPHHRRHRAAARSLPRTLAVVGAGVIGIEYASIFAALGVAVTLVERRERPLEFLDREIVDELIHQMRDAQRDVPVRRGGGRASAVADGPPRRAVARARVRASASSPTWCCSRPGASPPPTSLNLAAAGLAADERGRLHRRRAASAPRCRTSSRRAT